MLANFIYTCARYIRRLPGVEKTRCLWDCLRKPYYKVLNLDGAGVALTLPCKIQARVPAEFTSMGWLQYEPECAVAVAEYLGRYPQTLFLDIGCSVGFYSVLALSASAQSEVIAFDSDIVSLKATQYACKYVGVDRLRLVHGFVSDRQASRLGLDDAVTHTRGILGEKAVTADPHIARYVCIHGNTETGIPTHSLDGLFFAGPAMPEASLLIKCDVEGAEFLVLKGAGRLLEEWPVQMLIEIHAKISEYGHSRSDIRSYLNSRGYQVEPLATKTGREYWWCKRPS